MTETDTVPKVELAPRPKLEVCESARAAQELADYVTTCKQREKMLVDYFQPQVEQAHWLHKALVAQRDEACRPFRDGQTWATSLVKAWQRAEEQKQIELQRKIDEDARKAAIAEAKREGDKVLAKQIAKGTIAVAAPIAAAPPPKIEGFRARRVWKAACTDLSALVAAVAKGKAPVSLLSFDQVAGNKFAAATRGGAVVPGVRFWQD